MENLFTIPIGEKTISVLLNPMCRRSYMYKIGQEALKNPIALRADPVAFLIKHKAALLYFGYLEYCKHISREAEYTEKNLLDLMNQQPDNDEALGTALAKLLIRYSKLEETEPTVITEIFA